MLTYAYGQVVSELCKGMRLVKLQASEAACARILTAARERELQELKWQVVA
jgi:hypothetical protein